MHRITIHTSLYSLSSGSKEQGTPDLSRVKADAVDRKLILHTRATLTRLPSPPSIPTPPPLPLSETKSIMRQSKCQSWMCIHVVRLILRHKLAAATLQLQLPVSQLFQRESFMVPHKVYGLCWPLPRPHPQRIRITPRSIEPPNKVFFFSLLSLSLCLARARIFYCFPSILICFFYTS